MSIELTGTLVLDELDQDKSYTVTSIPVPGVELPKTGVVLLYGAVDSMKGIPVEFERAFAQNKTLYPVIVEVELGDSNLHQLGMDELADTKVLHLPTAKASITNRMLDIVIETLKSLDMEGELIPGVDIDPNGVPRQSALHNLISRHPWLLDYVHKQDEFKHLSMIVHKVSDSGRTFTRATLFDRQMVATDEFELPKIYIPKYMDVEVDLPDYLPDAVTA